MVTSALLEMTLGVAFYLLPVITFLATGVYLLVRRRRARTGRALPDAWSTVKDPLLMAGVLGASGVVVVSFITGRIDWDEYSGVPPTMLSVIWEGVSDWEKAGSSQSIALKGGVLIAAACTILFSTSLIRYYRRLLSEKQEGISAPGSRRA